MPSITIDAVHPKSSEAVMHPRILLSSAPMRRRSALVSLTVLLLGTPATARAQVLNTVALDQPFVIGGRVSTGRVLISVRAPSDGLVVLLSSSDPAVVTVPAAAAVVGGASTGSFTLQTVAVAQSTTVTITASFRGVDKTARVTVLGPRPSTVTLAPSALLGAGSATATVTLSSPAPAGGLVVQLSSSHPGVATLPASVTVPATGTAASSTVTTVPVAQSTAVTITATVGSESKAAQLTVSAPHPTSVALERGVVFGGTSSTGHVTLNSPAPPGDLVVQLSTSHPAVVQVQAAVKVKAGTTSGSFTFHTSPVVEDRLVIITASGGSGSRTANLTVATFSFTLAPSTITTHENFGTTVSTTTTGTVSLKGPAPAGGLVVQLSSSNPPVVGVPAFVIVPAGNTTASFGVALGPGAVFQGTVTLTATVSGVSKTAQLTVNRI